MKRLMYVDTETNTEVEVWGSGEIWEYVVTHEGLEVEAAMLRCTEDEVMRRVDATFIAYDKAAGK